MPAHIILPVSLFPASLSFSIPESSLRLPSSLLLLTYLLTHTATLNSATAHTKCILKGFMLQLLPTLTRSVSSIPPGAFFTGVPHVGSCIIPPVQGDSPQDIVSLQFRMQLPATPGRSLAAPGVVHNCYCIAPDTLGLLVVFF